jgi:hypothetical protein
VPDTGDAHGPQPRPVDPLGFAPKPPIWRGTDQGHVSARHLTLGGAGVLLILALSGIVGLSWIEETFFTTGSDRVVLQVIRMEGTNPGDQTSLTTFHYIVALPDRTEARLISERTYRVGTRLEANISRGRITKRVLVAGPYVVLAE